MELAEDVKQRLDSPYIEITAKAIVEALAENAPIEVNYQPGDRTSYRLLFVPLQDLRCAPGRLAPIRGHSDDPIRWDARFSFGAPRSLGSVLIAWLDHAAIGLDLASGGFVGNYLASIFDTTEASGYALAMLFDGISERLSLGRVAEGIRPG